MPGRPKNTRLSVDWLSATWSSGLGRRATQVPVVAESRGVCRVAICQLGLVRTTMRELCREQWAQLTGTCRSPLRRGPARVMPMTPRGPCWNTRPFAGRIRPLPGSGTRAGALLPPVLHKAGPTDFAEPPGLSPQAPKHPGQRDKDASYASANQRGAACGRASRRPPRTKAIYSAPACDLGVQAPGPQTKGDGEDAGASALRGWQCARTLSRTPPPSIVQTWTWPIWPRPH